MNLGRELVACALRKGTLRPFIEAGITDEWLTDQNDLSRAAIFDSEDLNAWFTLARHQAQFGKAPSMDLFQRSHPAESYRLPKSDYEADELLEIYRQDRRRYLTQLVASDVADAIGQDRIDDALELMALALKVVRTTYAPNSIVVDWDSKDYDLEGRIHREITHGVMTGLDGFDSQDGFYGFQPGSLTCYLGRAKAGKTSFALLSALRAWEDGKKVLFLTFEIAAGKLPSEPGVADRLDCFGSGIDLLHYMQGELTRQEQDKLREFRADCTDEAFRIVQPIGRYTIDDLSAEMDRYEPDVVYIDGFYFMIDKETGKSGGQWEGHDNLASDLKKLAMANMIPVVISHQVREKQLTGKKGAGIDDGAMMGGTAIIMFADLVLGVDADEDGLRTLSCTRSRLQYLKTIHGTWDWSTCAFTEQEVSVDEGKFGYGEDKDDADAPW